jgi:hypothetical protein
MPDDTKVDGIVKWLKNNSVLAVVIFVGISVIAIAQVITSFEDIRKAFIGQEPAAGSSAVKGTDPLPHVPKDSPRRVDTQSQDPRFPSGQALARIDGDQCKYIVFPGIGGPVMMLENGLSYVVSVGYFYFDDRFRRMELGDILFHSALVLKNYGAGTYKAKLQMDTASKPAASQPEPALPTWNGTFALSDHRFYQMGITHDGFSPESALTLREISIDEAKRVLATTEHLPACESVRPGVSW